MNQHTIVQKYRGRADVLRNKLQRLGLPVAFGRGNNFINAQTLADYYQANPRGNYIGNRINQMFRDYETEANVNQVDLTEYYDRLLHANTPTHLFELFEEMPEVKFKSNNEHLDRLKAKNERIRHKREEGIQGRNLRSLFNQINASENYNNDSFARDFMSAVNENENLTFSDLHMKSFDLDEMSNLTMRMFGDKFVELMNEEKNRLKRNSYPSIMLQLDVTDGNGNDFTIWRNITDGNIKFFKKLFKNNGVYEHFENIANDSDTDWVSNKVKVNNITIIDISQLPKKKRTYIKKNGAHWNWLFDCDLDCFDLSRYQIYKSIDEIDDTNCLVFALKQSGKVSDAILNDIKRDIGDKKYVELDTVKFIARKYKLNIWIYVVEKTIRPVQKIEFGTNAPMRASSPRGASKEAPITLALMNNHYFLREKIPFNIQYFKYRNDERLKQFPFEKQLLVETYYQEQWCFYDKPPMKDNIEVLRKLFTFNAFTVIEDYEEAIKIRRKKQPKIKEVEFVINDNNFDRYKLSKEYLSKFYSTIPNLYKINGNMLNCVMNCLRGGRVLISKKQHLKYRVISLDINSFLAYAMTICGIQTGIPKVFNDYQRGLNIREIARSNINSAFMLIRITSYKTRKYPVINDLRIGEVWVDLITLKDLIEYHDIEGTLINGFYYDAPIDYSITELINELYRLKSDKSLSQEERAEYKLKLNKIYGLSLKRTIMTKTKHVKNDDLCRFIQTNYNQIISAKKLDDNWTEVEMYKKFTNHYNLAHFGVSILSTARHIMNEYLYKCEENGIDILYSCTDSLFIKYEDLSLFNKLFPDSIGPNLGQFKIDLDGHDYASEAIFISKGCYCLKFDDGTFKIRWARKRKSEIIEYGVWRYYLRALE